MINTEFETREMEIYTADPPLAIRDMNRVAAERRRLIDESIRETEERQAYNSRH